MISGRGVIQAKMELGISILGRKGSYTKKSRKEKQLKSIEVKISV